MNARTQIAQLQSIISQNNEGARIYRYEKNGEMLVQLQQETNEARSKIQAIIEIEKLRSTK